MHANKRLSANKFLFSIGVGLSITFGLCVGLAQASNQVMQSTLPSATAFYVDATASGEATGLTWSDAFTTVQDALAVAASGDQIWVAEGVYYPDEGTGQVNDLVDSTFTLTNGVSLYGGFDPGSGVENFTERDAETYVTVLSGDIDHETNPDITDPNGVVTDTNHIVGENAYHVVSSNNVTTTAVIDGFSITAGHANGSYIDLCGPACGGGMNNYQSSPTVVDAIFSGNSATWGDGGGMYNFQSSPTLTNVTFFGNSSGVGGGGMSNWKSSNPGLRHVNFIKNSADSDGGGMYNFQSSPTLDQVSFSHNLAGWGGGMSNSNHSSPTLNNVTFSENQAGYDGGGMDNYQVSNPILNNVFFSNNLSDRNGGGMHNVSSSPTLTSVTFSGNSATDDGGGMSNNSGSSPMLTHVTFAGNSARLGGGMSSYEDSRPTLTDVTFSGDSADYGGGMYTYNSNPALTNVIFSGNSADDGGGGMLNLDNSSPTLTNVTFSGNWAIYGGGMYNIDSSSPTLTNTILWNNQADSGSQILNNVSTPLIHFSDIQDAFDGSGTWDTALGTDGGGNLDADPLFERNPDPGANGWDGVDDDYGDLHLRPGSPAIDKGTNDGCPATDLDGNPRPVNICDMGAYETGYTLEISKTVDDATPQPGQTITFTIVVGNRSLDVSGGQISDTLPAGLNFLGPISLETGKSGTAGSMPPTLASGLAISTTDRITVTFPVTVSYGLISGIQLINTAAVSASEAITPVLASTTISVQNAAPLAVADSGTGFITDKSTTFTTTSVLTNDSDPNGDALTVSGLDTTGTKGLVTDNGDGTFTYNPNGQFDALEAGEQASDTFTYTISDGHGGSDTATVTITIYGELARFIYLPLIIR